MSFVSKIGHSECSGSLPPCDIKLSAVANCACLKIKHLLSIFSSLNISSIRRGVYMSKYTRSRAKSSRYHSIIKFQMFSVHTAAIFVPLGGAQIWRLHTEPYKFEHFGNWNISANKSRMERRTDLRLGEIVY